VAGVGQSHGINANVVHKWRRQAGGPLHSLQAPGFVPLPLPPSACAPAPDIRIELRRGRHQRLRDLAPGGDRAVRCVDPRAAQVIRVDPPPGGPALEAF
jgi:hypothetical protein